jgi:hypothetical protein
MLMLIRILIQDLGHIVNRSPEWEGVSRGFISISGSGDWREGRAKRG